MEKYINFDEINQTLYNYRNKKIHLREVLEYFQVEFFHNWVYSRCSDKLTDIVSVEEASIYCLLNYRDELTPLLSYPELADWKQLCDYVETLYSKNHPRFVSEIPNEELYRVSKIDWDTYDQTLRGVLVG